MADEKTTPPKINMSDIGRSGTLVSSEVINNDYLNEVIGVEGQEKYTKMLLSDATIRKLYHAVSNPIKSADWDIEPASLESKDIDAAALMKQIIFEDIPGGWTGKLDEILTFPWHGHGVFEIVHANKTKAPFGPYTGLKNLAFRSQQTLDKWKFNGEGLLEFIHQKQSGDIEIDIDIPAEFLLIFYNEKKGDDNGFPFCRMLYGNYKRKLLYKQLQAIGIERSAIPVPHLELPPSVELGSEEYIAAQDQLAAFTMAEQAYFITPAGYKLNYNQTGTFDPGKVQLAIKAENEEIAGSLVAMFLEMGIGGNSAVGSSTSVSAKVFKDGIEYIANKICETINQKVIKDLCFLNYGDTLEKLPKLVQTGISEGAGVELMTIVKGYTDGGIIISDSKLEDHVRKQHNLPKRAEGEILDNKNTPEPPPGEEPVTEEPTQEAPTTEVQLSEKTKIKTPKDLMESQAQKIQYQIKKALKFSSDKFINDTMNKYKQLPENKKQKATDKLKMGGSNLFKTELKRLLAETSALAIDMAKKEVPTDKPIELKLTDETIGRYEELYGDISYIKLNTFSKLPTYAQILIQKQADLISSASLEEMQNKLEFAYSTAETKTADQFILLQAMQDAAEKFIDSASVVVKAENVTALMVNESRQQYFTNEEVEPLILSYTFLNDAPKSKICIELAGTTFSTNDAKSLSYTPPLHHNCKSYLRANLASSTNVNELEISTLSPSAAAIKTITL